MEENKAEDLSQYKEEFNNLCKPLVDFLYKHGSPYSAIIITQAYADLVSGELGVEFPPRD